MGLELACDLITASTRIGSRRSKDNGKDACYPRCYFFAALLAVSLRKFSKDMVILAELVHLKEPPTSMRPEPTMNYVRRAVWGMLHADNACIVSRPPQRLAREDDGGRRRGLPSLRLNCVGEEDRDHVHASTAYTADDGAINSRIGRENLQTGAILHLPGGCRS